jgi:hypothetical protein
VTVPGRLWKRDARGWKLEGDTEYFARVRQRERLRAPARVFMAEVNLRPPKNRRVAPRFLAAARVAAMPSFVRKRREATRERAAEYVGRFISAAATASFASAHMTTDRRYNTRGCENQLA